jgi:hypothetical protein
MDPFPPVADDPVVWGDELDAEVRLQRECGQLVIGLGADDDSVGCDGLGEPGGLVGEREWLFGGRRLLGGVDVGGVAAVGGRAAAPSWMAVRTAVVRAGARTEASSTVRDSIVMRRGPRKTGTAGVVVRTRRIAAWITSGSVVTNAPPEPRDGAV